MKTKTPYLQQQTDPAPLALFRILFGLLMAGSIIRFWANGWVEKLYIQPAFHFTYYGFEWVKPLGNYTYLLFFLCGISALSVAIGYKYRLAIITFFLTFTYIELMDKTTYLNHYYFISLLSFLMIFLPASSYFSLDAKKNGHYHTIPRWSIDAIKLLITIVYIHAGLAKLNSDWLIHAMPLKIWLPSNYDLPILGGLMHKEWVSYTFSWAGALYDLTIPFLLLWKPTHTPAFILVVIFHVLTRMLFPIGMFPYIMIVSALIFFDPTLHHKLLRIITTILPITPPQASHRAWTEKPAHQKWRTALLITFFTAQLFIPWRYLLYPGELFWTEQGYRFSWRVMLMEKAGYANFRIENPQTNQRFYVDNSDFLTPLQEKQMATQPDLILQYAQHLARHYQSQGQGPVEVYVESHVALNGRRSQPYIDPTINLANQTGSFKHKTWILPFNHEIKGL